MDISEIFRNAAKHRVIRLGELCLLIGLSPSTVRNRTNPRSRWFDPRFPQPIPIGNGSGSRCAKGWLLDEVMAYLDALAATSMRPSANSSQGQLRDRYDGSTPLGDDRAARRRSGADADSGFV